MSLATHLAESGCNVIAVDNVAALVSEAAEVVTYAATTDSVEVEALRELGIANVQIVVICIGDMEASILTTLACKEIGVPKIIAKATTEAHAKILEKVGADMTLIPEAAMGSRLAKNIMGGMFLDLFEISDKFSLAELEVPSEWIGHTLAELNIREKYKLNIVAIKNKEEVTVNLAPDTAFAVDDIMIVAGDNEHLQKFNEK